MKAFVFPGQGAQYVGMGKEIYDNSEIAKVLFEEANDILGFRITDIMFGGTDEGLKQTKVTQPAIFLHSVIAAKTLRDRLVPDLVAGHSLGEFSALVVAQTLSFKDGLMLVAKRAEAMQKACEMEPSAMAAILGLDDDVIENACNEIEEVVIPANYNCPGQVVISGSVKGIDLAIAKLTALGAKRAIKLNVSGAFHSPFMEPAKIELEKAIDNTLFSQPICPIPIYQNVTAQPNIDPQQIKENLKKQLTSPVRWTQTIKNMIDDGKMIDNDGSSFIEIGPGNVLQGLVKKVNREAMTSGIG